MEKKKRIAHTAIMLQSETQLSPHYEIKDVDSGTPTKLLVTFYSFCRSKVYRLHTYIHRDMHVCACRKDTDTEKAAGKK